VKSSMRMSPLSAIILETIRPALLPAFFTVFLAAFFVLSFAAAFLVLPVPSARGESTGEVTFTDPGHLSQSFQNLARAQYGDYGIFFQIPVTGEEAGYQQDKIFTAASCYKVFLVMYVYENAAAGRINLDEVLVYTSSDYTDGTGIIQFMPLGTCFTVRQLCRLAITHSDNVAANMLRRRFGYVPYRNYAASLGCPVSGRTDGRNQTTARELGVVLRRVLAFAAENPLGQEVIQFLKDDIYRTRIPAGVPSYVPVGNKTGDYAGYMNDMAIVFTEDTPYILVVLSYAASGDGGHARISSFTYGHVSSRLCTGGHCAPGLREPGKEWYFAEGYTGPGFHEWLCLENPGDQASLVRLEYFTQEAGALEPRLVSVPAASRTTVFVNQSAGENYQVSCRLTVLEGPGIVAERPMYFYYGKGKYGEGWTGGHTATGIPAPATEWNFAEGCTREGFEEYVTVLNPGEEEARITLYFQIQGRGQAVVDGGCVPPRSRATYSVNRLAGDGLELSLRLVASAPVVAERPMYFRYGGLGNHGWTGGHCVPGSTSLSRSYYLAEGTTRQGFEEWLTIQNPNATAEDIVVTYFFTSGSREPLRRAYRVDPLSRRTLSVNQEVGPGWDVAMTLEGEAPFGVERPMYFRYAGCGAFWSGGHCVAGTASPGKEWHFAEGYTGRGFHEWLCLFNPGDEASTVEIRCLLQDGGGVIARLHQVPARSRSTLRVNDLVGGCFCLSLEVRVLEGPPILAERPMYFNYGCFGR